MNEDISSFAEQTSLLEKRIVELEARIEKLQNLSTRQSGRISVLDNKLPNTSLLSPNFLVRAFTVWGYFVVAQVLLIVIFYGAVFGLGMLFVFLAAGR